MSRRFVRATGTALAELLARDLSNLKVAAMMVDGLHIAEHLMVVALAISTDGRKVPVGLYEGDTENRCFPSGRSVRGRGQTEATPRARPPLA